MTRLFYYFNRHGGITISAYAEDGTHKRCVYIGYSLREAIQKFRRDNNLRYKHLTIQKL